MLVIDIQQADLLVTNIQTVADSPFLSYIYTGFCFSYYKNCKSKPVLTFLIIKIII